MIRKKIFRELRTVVITFIFILTNFLIVLRNVAACLPEVTIEKQVQDPTSGIWVDALRILGGTQLDFRISISDTYEIVVHNLLVINEFSSLLEYRNNANYTETSVSSDLRAVIGDFCELCIGQTITITYQAEAVKECYGSNIGTVTAYETGVSNVLVRGKVHGID